MSEANGPPATGFNAGLVEFLRTVVYRPPNSRWEKDDIYKLRYAAYDRAGVLAPGASEYFRDEYDDSPNSTTLGLYIKGLLAATMRVHVATPSYRLAPSLQAFKDELQPLLDSGKVLVDPTRHVVSAAHAKEFPRLPYATIRVPWMACEHYAADYVLATIPAHHQAFYRRVFGLSRVYEARKYPGISVPIILLVLDYGEARARVHERYPYLRSTPQERVAIFGGALNPELNRAAMQRLSTEERDRSTT